MCGVAGYVNLDGRPASPVILRAMTDALAHRGPDGEGQIVHENAALGHRRLAIIDLSPLAHQPMVTRDDRLVLSYNGEIYNFLELRTQLEALGHGFRSRSDTEVVLEAFAEWGDEAVSRFNGMFAFALLSRRERRLILARDRFGVKPIYYVQAGQSLLFASEIKAFLAHPAFRAEMDPDGLREYMTFQNFLAERTLLRGVKILPAGCILSVPLAGPVGEPKRYWDYNFVERPEARSREELVEELDRLFVQAVSRQLVSDVPVSAYLSGGVDTGSITAVASRQLNDMRTFTIGFDTRSVSGLELAYDEREQAEFVSSLCRTEHYEMVLKSGDMERAIESLVWHLEEPRVGQSYPNFYAAKLAGSFNKVVLSGAGGDELFAGYPWRYYRAATSANFDEYASRYFDFWQRLVPADSFDSITAPVRHANSADMLEVFKGVFHGHENALNGPVDYINHSLYFEARTFLHGLLVVEDKLSMAHGLESRVPFLDNDLVDFAMRLPARYKLAELDRAVRMNENEPGQKTTRYRQSKDGKIILRQTLARYVPEEIATGAKQGFSGPDASWFRGESIDYVRDRVLARNAKLYEFLDFDTAERLVQDHLDGRENRRLLIWSLIYLESWCRQFLSGNERSVSRPKEQTLSV